MKPEAKNEGMNETFNERYMYIKGHVETVNTKDQSNAIVY